ncbi:MAG: tetratricopeptide repeat protein [Alphaproteobacteria bacterium]|nr:tetratricopeptide repeat protein [Alphaproteobacteria bacterium]
MGRAAKIGVGILSVAVLIAGAAFWFYAATVDTAISPAKEPETQSTAKKPETQSTAKKPETQVAKKTADGLRYAQAGLNAHKAGDLDQAIELYSQAIEAGDLEEQKLAFAYNNRGAAQKSKGLYDLAIEDYSSAVSLMPSYARSYYNRAITYASAGSYELAIKDYGTAIKLKPDSAKAFNNRALAREKLGRYDLAIDDLSQAIQLSPDLAFVYFNRGRIYQATDDWQRAIDDIKKAVSLNSDNSDYLAKLKQLQLLKQLDREVTAAPTVDAEALTANSAATDPLDVATPVSSKSTGLPVAKDTPSQLLKTSTTASLDKVLPLSTDKSDTQVSSAAATDPSKAATARAGAGETVQSDENIVLLIQSRLKDQGFDPGPLDGLMGPRTRTAIGDYQRKYGLAVDGKPSRQLLERLGREQESEIRKAEDG